MVALQDTKFFGKKKIGCKKRLFRRRDGPRGSQEEKKTKSIQKRQGHSEIPGGLREKGDEDK